VICGYGSLLKRWSLAGVFALKKGQRISYTITELQQLTGLCQKLPQQGASVTVTSLGVLVYAAANEVRRIRVRAV
jgi:hypothetical protein